jgi:flagellar protein FlaJ
VIAEYLPLAVAACLLAPVALSPVSRTADLLVTRVAVSLFGGYVDRRTARRADQRSLLRAARVGQSHRVYAARTILFAGVVGVVGGVAGSYAGGTVVEVFRANQEALGEVAPPGLGAAVASVPSFGLDEVFVLLLASSALLGLGGGAVVYYARWEVLNQRAVARASAIEATLPRTVAFVYALSRSGTAFPKVLETLSANRRAYGEAAEELGMVAREMSVFGTDAVTALGRMTEHTPSETMDEFGDNLASVLGSGRSLAPFLREQYDRYQDEARSQQQQHLDLLSTFAEVYVTLFVALPVFLVTILGIVGLVLDDTLTLLRVLGYVALPSLTFAYVVYVDSVTETLPDRVVQPDVADPDEDRDPRHAGRPRARADGGTTNSADRANAGRLAAYDRIESVRRRLRHPVESLVGRPLSTLLVTVPVGVAWLLARAWPVPLDASAVPVVDGPLVEATLVVLVGYAVAHELRIRRTRRIDRAVPDFLDRMASLDEAGLTVVGSLRRATRGDLGPLGDEVRRAWRDIEWGADAETALRRLDRRVGSVSVSQAVALVTNAMRASGDLAPVLRIAAEEAQQARRLRRERSREMFTYLLVIYVSALVFLGIVVGIILAFFPAIESAASASVAPTGTTGGPSATVTGGLGDVDLDAYRTVFFHLAVVQALCSGLVAGQLGEGNVPDGVKHAAALLGVTYVVFLFV